MMDLPIPTHLQPFFTVIGDKNNEHSVTGTVHCSCGCEQFEVWESNDRSLVKLVCRECGKRSPSWTAAGTAGTGSCASWIFWTAPSRSGSIPVRNAAKTRLRSA